MLNYNKIDNMNQSNFNNENAGEDNNRPILEMSELHDLTDPDTGISLCRPVRQNVALTFNYNVERLPGQLNGLVTKRYIHKGLDLAPIIPGDPQDYHIYASISGQTVVAGRGEREGNWVAIRKGDLMFYYMHCKKLFVKTGQIFAGDELALMGSSGSSTAKHLHFQVNKYNRSVGKFEPVNPWPYLYCTPDALSMVIRQY